MKIELHLPFDLNDVLNYEQLDYNGKLKAYKNIKSIKEITNGWQDNTSFDDTFITAAEYILNHPPKTKQDNREVSIRFKDTSKVSKELAKITDDQTKLISTGGKTEVGVNVSVQFNEPKPELMQGKMQLLSDIIETLRMAGNYAVSYVQLASYFYHSENPYKTQIQEIEELVSIARKTDLNICYENEIRGGLLDKDIKRAGYEVPLLEVYPCFIENANGKISRGIIIKDTPILARHAKDTNQYMLYPMQVLFDVNKQLSSTPAILKLEEIISDEIHRTKNKRNKTIRYETIYTKLGKDKATPTERNRIRTQIKKILDSFKTHKVIKNYEEFKEGRTYAGIKLKF